MHCISSRQSYTISYLSVVIGLSEKCQNLHFTITLRIPGVDLTLCCFVVYSTRRFVLYLTLCYFGIALFSHFSIAITSLEEERELNLVLFVRLADLCLFGFFGFSSPWCLGRAAVCDCGTPWTFLLSFFFSLSQSYTTTC